MNDVKKPERAGLRRHWHPITNAHTGRIKMTKEELNARKEERYKEAVQRFRTEAQTMLDYFPYLSDYSEET